MDNLPQDNSLAAQKNEYNSRLLAIWSAKVSEMERIIEHERQSRAKIEREGNNTEQITILQQQTQARQQIMDERYGKIEADLDSKWKVIEKGINEGMTWEKMDAMEKIGSATPNCEQLREFYPLIRTNSEGSFSMSQEFLGHFNASNLNFF